MYVSVEKLGEGNLMSAMTAGTWVDVVLESQELDVMVKWNGWPSVWWVGLWSDNGRVQVDG